MDYLDNKHNIIDEQTADKLLEAHEKELEEQPNTLGQQQLAAKKAIKEEREKKELKVPWYKKEMILGHVSTTDKMLFMDNLATMLKAGLALAPALSTLREETRSKYMKSVLTYIKKKVENGELFSDGMKQYPKAFPEMMTATIEVGEASGLLSETLGHLADILKAEKQLKSKIFSALMYPSVVLIALIAVSFVLTFYVFPQLVSIFEEAGVKLPVILLIVQGATNAVINYGWYMLGGLVVLIVGCSLIFRHYGAKLWLHTFVLSLPFVGNLIKQIALTRLCGNLHVLLNSGLPIIKALNVIAKTLGNLRYKETIVMMAGELEKGVSMHAAMAERPKLFPSLMIQLVQVGEETGELESILTKVAAFYEDKVNNVLNNLSVIIEPVLLILVGVVVGFIAVSVIGPIYELTNSFAE